jgi:hypothetical protein
VKHLVLAFHGHFERDNSITYAMGDDAPVFVHGANDDDALERFTRGLLLYVDALAEQGQLDAAVRAGMAQLRLSAPVRSHQLSRVQRDADHFEIELTGTR